MTPFSLFFMVASSFSILWYEIWKGDSSNIFFCKFLWHIGNLSLFFYYLPNQVIWKEEIPWKVQIFALLASEGEIQYMWLSSKKETTSLHFTILVCFVQKQRESIDHILWHCKISNFKFLIFYLGSWAKVFKELGLFKAPPLAWHDFILMDGVLSGIRKKFKCLWRCITISVAWGIRLERNGWIF